MVTRRGAPGEDHDAVTREVLADGLAPSLRERLAGSAPSRMGARHRTVLVRVAMLLAATTLGVGAAVHALRAADAPAVAAPRLVGISISETPPGPDPAVRGAVEATYRFAPLAPGSRLRLAGLAGPLVHASATRRVPAARGGGPVFRVSATPACRHMHEPDPAPPRYSVALTRTASDGTSTRLRLRPARASVDWGMALRQVCWQELATRGLGIADLRAEPDGRGLVLTVSLRSSLLEDVAVQVIDVADVSTLAASDRGQLPAGGRRDFRVRWPVADCAAPTLPQHTFLPTSSTAGEVLPALEWTIGPSRRNPAAALFVTPLSPRQLATVRAAVDRVCTPKGTTVEVASARALPPDPVLTEQNGVAITMRLSLVSHASRIVVGDSPTGLTADARVAITQAKVRLVRGRGSATVVWRARCSPRDPAPPRLPMAVESAGRIVDAAVTVADSTLARTYARACGIDETSLLAAGWGGPRTATVTLERGTGRVSHPAQVAVP